MGPGLGPAAGKASSCTRALSTAGFGVSAPKGEWRGADGPNQLLLQVAEILEPYAPAAQAAWSGSSARVSCAFCPGLLPPADWSVHPSWVTADIVLNTDGARSRCDNLSACTMCSLGPLSTVTQLFPMEDAVPALSKAGMGRPKRQSEALSRKCALPSACCTTFSGSSPSC